MTRIKSENLVRDFEALFGAGTLAGLGDGPLLERFIARRDEAAFEELIARHGPVVLAICRRWLDDPRDVEDAFQATFLLLVQKASALRDRSAVSCWLQGVALRVARRARANALRRRLREASILCEPADRPRAGTGDEEILAAVAEEVRRLPENQQIAVALCLLEGHTHEAAAGRLGWPLGTVKSRIAAARQTLTRRLTRRGLAPSVVAAALRTGPVPVGAIPTRLVQPTIEAARAVLGDSGLSSAGTSTAIAGLVQEVSRLMLEARMRSVAWLVAACGALAWAAPALLSARPAGQGGQGEPRIQALPVAAAQPSGPKTDRYGDPLPPGAAMRLGTVRFRQFPHVCRVAYSPDGRFVVTDTNESTLQYWDARDGRKLRQIDAGMEQIRDFAFSPDGTQIAAVGCGPVPDRLRWSTHLAFLDVATGRLIRHAEWGLKAGDQDLAYSPDGRTVAIDEDDGTLRLWDVASAQVTREERLGGRHYLASIAFSPVVASRLLAVASDRVIHIRDAGTLRDVRTIVVEGEHEPTDLAFSPDGTTLAAGIARSGAEVRLWRVGDGALIKRFKGRESRPAGYSVSHVLFSPDGKLLAAVGYGVPLVLFDVESGQERAAFGKGTNFDLVGEAAQPDAPMAFSPDGKTLATLAARQSLHFWDLATARDGLATPEAHLGGVYDLAIPADGKSLISGSSDRTVRVWDMATGRTTKVLPHDGWVWSLAVSADGKFLAAGVGYPRNVHLWNLETGQRLHAWPIAGTSSEDVKSRAVTSSQDGSAVIVAMADGSLLGWDLGTGKERAIAQSMRKKPPAAAAALPPVPHTARLAAFSRDGRSKVIVRVIPGQSIKLLNGEIRYDRPSAGSAIVWLDTETGHARREIEIPQSDVQRLALSPDDQLVAVGYFSTIYPPARGFIRIFRLRDKQLIRTIESPCPWIDALRFTPDGKQIVAGLQDSSIVIWDVAAPGGERAAEPALPAGRSSPR